MHILRTLAFATLLAISVPTLAADNARIQQLKDADQSDRRGSISLSDWPEIQKRDAERRDALIALLRAGEVRTATDYYNAAMIMQHGETPEDIRMAHAFSAISASIDPSNRSAKWLVAASWDRLLMRLKRPQWYGTQYVSDATGKWALHEVDETAVTDEDRRAMAAPTLAEAKARADAMNGAR